jgi:type IV pilus assembly protein PilX
MKRHPHLSANARPPRRERGVVLFIALIVMVALSLAGLALMRSVDTSTTVSGNLAFRQSSITMVNAAVETAIKSLWDGAGALDETAKQTDHVAVNYYAMRQPGEVKGIPAALQGPPGAAPPLYGGLPVIVDGVGKNEVRFVIERMCNAVGKAMLSTCDLTPPKQGTADQIGEDNTLVLGRVPFYRVTIRVDGPSNTVTFAQAMLR